MKFLDVLKSLAPIIIAAIPQGQKYGPAIISGIALAEASSKSGKDKKEIALASVALSANIGNAIAGEVKIDPSAAVIVADDTIDSIVALVNQSKALTEDSVVTSSQSPDATGFVNPFSK
jgi:hypothetical protein